MILLLSPRVRKEGVAAIEFILRYAAIMSAALFVVPALDRSQHPAVRLPAVQFLRSHLPDIPYDALLPVVLSDQQDVFFRPPSTKS